ncbi:response regulator [Methylophaga sp. OBS4]|uniref:response regulator n=1 Tax=Methylophaga sp. OBS4 TaxID=2991935 RepID=UPI00224E412B|nr:response regulator [Methylophaga sp. OBS4]MCX4187200.1 response regulator [Methylophaga sp. OBS4]
MEQALYTTTQAAKIFGVTPRTIQMWADSGMIEVTKTLGGHRRITADEIERLAKRFGKVLPENKKTLSEPDSSTAVRQSGDSVRIMIIDDDKDLLKLYQMQIESWQTPKTEVYLASDGYDALLQIGAKKPDIIITDLRMPRMDGGHMIKMIQQTPDMAHCQIVVVTDLNKGEIQQNFELPDSVVLEEKPIPFARIQRLVNDYLNTSDVINPS